MCGDFVRRLHVGYFCMWPRHATPSHSALAPSSDLFLYFIWCPSCFYLVLGLYNTDISGVGATFSSLSTLSDHISSVEP
jgi:hypothetical protein